MQPSPHSSPEIQPPQEEIVEGAYSVVPQKLAEIPGDLTVDHRLTALAGLARRQELNARIMIEEYNEDRSEFVERIVATDSQLYRAKMQTQAAQARLAVLGDELTTTQVQRDKYISLSEQGAFGGLLNKKAYKERATMIVEHDRREETRHEPKTVVFMDLDDLNKLNSILSETIVDKEVLEPVALIMAKHQRGGEVTGIWGGDEFAKVVRGMDADQVMKYLSSLQHEVNDIVVNPAFAGADKIMPRLSMGFAVVRPGETYVEAETRASRAKEYAKEQPGKNAIVNSDDVPENWTPTRKSRAS
jgi:diguanylate cyclase (GGDEF)-like protein